MKFFYKIILIFGIILIFAPLGLVLLETYKIPFNNYYLKTLQNNFHQSIKSFHPAQSNLITEMAEVGNWADGTTCQFFVGEFRSSVLLKEELEKKYPDDFFTAGVYFFDDKDSIGSPWLEWKEKYLKNYKQKEGENIYLVWSADEDNPSNGDFRCD